MTRDQIQHVLDTIFNQVFNQGQADLMPGLVSGPYIQHNPLFPIGLACGDDRHSIQSALDMRFASREKALIGQPEIILGLRAGAGGTARLVQLMGRGRAFEAALSGRPAAIDVAPSNGRFHSQDPGGARP